MEDDLDKLAQELNISKETIWNVYKAYWQFIREKITSLHLKKEMSEYDYSKLKTNFNLPSLGKLNCSYDRWLRVKKSNQIKLNSIKDAKYKED